MYPHTIVQHIRCTRPEGDTVKQEQEKPSVRSVDTQIFLNAVKTMIQEGHDVPVTITGNSMSPFLIHGRDRILLSRISHPLHKGDMVLYQRKNSQYVMHRIRCIKKARAEYYMIGDAQNVTEGPVGQDQICAVATAVCRKGTWLRPGDFQWEFFRRVWLHMIPVRRPVAGLYSFIVEKIRGRRQIEN